MPRLLTAADALGFSPDILGFLACAGHQPDEALADLRPKLARALPQAIHHLLGALRRRARPLPSAALARHDAPPSPSAVASRVRRVRRRSSPSAAACGCGAASRT